MARCVGCSSFSVSHTDTNCIHLTGDGTSGDHLVATLEISPDAGNELVCRTNGLYAPTGGGGGGGQVLYFTVGTPGPNGFGGVGATPPTLLASADFTGDGINDSVAIQAAIDASAALTATSGIGAVVLILPGIYFVNTSLRPKDIPIIGQNVEWTFLYTTTTFGAAANTRTIDGTIAGADFTHLENLQIFNQTGGAAIIKTQQLYMVGCQVTGDGKGADAGLLDIGTVGSTVSGEGLGRLDNNTIGGTSQPFPDPIITIRDPLFSNYSISNNLINGDLVFNGNNHQNVFIQNNLFSDGNIILNTTSLTYFHIRSNHLISGSITATLAGGSSFGWVVSDNWIFNGQINIDSLIVSKLRGNTIQSILFGDAFVLSNGGENIIEHNFIDGAKNNGMVLTSVSASEVIGNRIRDFSAGVFNTNDGIVITTSDRCNVQTNSLTSSNGRYGINAVSGTANFITNNRLEGSANTSSFNDTATGTVTVAGNYL